MPNAERDWPCTIERIPLLDRVGIVQLKQHFRSRAQQAFLKHVQQNAGVKNRDDGAMIV